MSESTRSKSPRPGPSLVVRPAREVRLIEESGKVVAYPQPHRTPVLPSGWAPLRREHQQAVLCACDAADECLVFRLGSLWETGAEYRVYRLANELWGGLSVVTKWTTAPGLCNRGPRNQRPHRAGRRQPARGEDCRGLLQLGSSDARTDVAAQRHDGGRTDLAEWAMGDGQWAMGKRARFALAP